MTLHESKFDPWPIIKGHYETFVDSAGTPRPRDYLQLILPPVVGGVIAALGHAAVSSGTGAAILTLAGLFAAFLFQLSIQVLERAAAWADTGPDPSPRTSEYATLLKELSGNAGYAALVSGATASLSLVAMLLPHGRLERLSAALLIALLVHLGLTLLLVANRTYLLTMTYINVARTGSRDRRA